MYSPSSRSIVLIAGESCLLVAAVAISGFLRLGDDAWRLLAFDDGLLKLLLVAAVYQLCLYYNDLYDLRTIGDGRDLFVRLVQSLGTTSLMLACVYYWFPDLIIGRGVFLISTGFSLTLVVGWRLAFRWLSSRATSERLLLVGTSRASVDLARELFERRQELGVDIVGFVDPDPARLGMPVLNPGVVGTIEDIPALVERFHVDRVVVSLSDARGKLPMDTLLTVRLDTGVTFDHLASVYEEYTGKIAVENLRPSWFIFSSGFRKTRLLRAQKRLLDLIASTVGLVLAAPIMAVVAAVVKLGSPGPILYHQRRVGLQGRHFTVHKFRTMRQDAEAATGPVWSGQNDNRINRVGQFLRRSRLDELPQLWNVLRGEMSLVGPRPERPEFVDKLTAEIPFYGQRHVVKPGATGWAQIRYTYGASVEDAIEKLQYDLFYIKNLSLALDIVIIAETVKTVLMRRGGR